MYFQKNLPPKLKKNLRNHNIKTPDKSGVFILHMKSPMWYIISNSVVGTLEYYD